MARQKAGFWYRFAVGLLKPPVLVFTRRRWLNRELLPATGGIVVAPNHNTHFDPLVVAHYLNDSGRPPRFLAKDGLFDVPFIGHVLSEAGQIPVHRSTTSAADAMRSAVAAVEAGECVVVYPEGSLTRDPDLWPMRGKTGAARIALATGCPVIPMAHWGAQDVLAPYGKKPHLLPPRTVTVTVGPAVPLDDLMGRPITTDLLAEATDRIMDAISALLAELRDEPEPEGSRFDPRTAGVPETGKVHVDYQAEPKRRTS